MFDKIFEPIKIGNVEIKNRFIVPPMVINYCTEDGMVTEKFIKHHEEKAKGGWGLITIEQSVIAKKGRAHPGQPGLWSDDHIEGLSQLTKRVHDAGAKISVQINHGGRQSMSLLTGSQLVAPSGFKDPLFPETPRELTVDEIHEIVGLYGDAALRAKKAGFDMITAHVHGGYLLASFLSPCSNKRTDEYGGTLYNRARIIVEVLRNMREKVGSDFPILVRFNADEFVDGGLSTEDAIAFAQLMESVGADCIDVSVGNTYSYRYMVQPTSVAHGFVADISYQIKKAVSVPVAVAGRINDPLIAESILKTGKADLISMGRASIADPEFPNKVREGRLDEIRTCIACLQGCTGQVAYYKPLLCLVNPRISGEEKCIEQVEQSKKVLVVGGGIAGMEAAIIAAQRGHDVHLYEKGAKLGGQWLLAAIPPTKTELNTFTIWQKNELKKLNVKIHLNTEVTEQIIEQEKPDSVIVATGAQPIRPEIKGVDDENVVQSFDVLDSTTDVGNKVVIIGGGLVGAETADHLAVHGKKVFLIEMTDAIAKDGELPTNHFLFKRLEQYNVEVLTSAKVTEIASSESDINHVNSATKAIGAKSENTTPSKLLSVVYEKDNTLSNIDHVNNVILALGARPVNGLYEQLKDNIEDIILVGDAKQARDALAAISEGYQAGLSV